MYWITPQVLSLKQLVMFRRYLINIIFFILPATRCFAIKRSIARWAGITVGKDVCINGYTCFFGNGTVTIGDYSWIGLKNTFYRTGEAAIKIGKNCAFGPEVAFVPGSHEIGDKLRRAGKGKGGDIVVEDGCWIGARVTILGGVTISRGSVIAAGAVVCKDVEENSLSAGVPAVHKKLLNKNG